jgi:acetylornithine deacetylase
VGRIEGGQSVNVVPDWCEIEVDRRVLPGEKTLECPDEVERFLAERLGSSDGILFLPPWLDMPALSPGPSEQWLPPMREALERVLGREPRVFGVPFGTDAGPLAMGGLPCLVLGPGDIAQAHTKDEWVELAQVSLAAEVYFAIACALG